MSPAQDLWLLRLEWYFGNLLRFRERRCPPSQAMRVAPLLMHKLSGSVNGTTVMDGEVVIL